MLTDEMSFLNSLVICHIILCVNIAKIALYPWALCTKQCVIMQVYPVYNLK